MIARLTIRVSPKLKNMATVYSDLVKKQGKHIVYQIAKRYAAESRGMCPMDTGALRRSVYVNPPTIEDDVITCHFGYANSETDNLNWDTGLMTSDYAVEVHESLQFHHIIGEHKFLERALNNNREHYKEHLARPIRELLSTRL